MLWSQFSAIFPNFRQKIGVFLKYQCYDQLFSKFSFVLSQKRQFCKNFRRKYFKNHNIGPWSPWLRETDREWPDQLLGIWGIHIDFNDLFHSTFSLKTQRKIINQYETCKLDEKIVYVCAGATATYDQGCQILLGTKYQNWKIYTK
jgi:hypothetical protein